MHCNINNYHSKKFFALPTEKFFSPSPLPPPKKSGWLAAYTIANQPHLVGWLAAQVFPALLPKGIPILMIALHTTTGRAGLRHVRRYYAAPCRPVT